MKEKNAMTVILHPGTAALRFVKYRMSGSAQDHPLHVIGALRTVKCVQTSLFVLNAMLDSTSSTRNARDSRRTQHSLIQTFSSRELLS